MAEPDEDPRGALWRVAMAMRGFHALLAEDDDMPLDVIGLAELLDRDLWHAVEATGRLLPQGWRPPAA